MKLETKLSAKFLKECWASVAMISLPKNLGPNNTLGDQVQLGHFHHSKMDLIQILVIFSHKKLNPIVYMFILQNKRSK